MKKNILLIAIALISFTSCEDKIDLELDNGKTQYVVDAFVNSDSTLQTIRVSKTAEYFLNARTPGVNSAKVKIIGPSQTEYIFQYQTEGYYTYNPTSNVLGPIDSIGFEYQLIVELDGEVYKSKSILNPVPPIDYMEYEYIDDEPEAEPGYYAEFYAIDFEGRNDFYWIKAFKNGETIDPTNPTDYQLSQNAAFSGFGADGFPFILPIRTGINNFEEPFEKGDTSSVELYSINEDIWNYLIQLATQANNGGLFATPTANIKSNITDFNGNIQNEVLGAFSVSSISRNSIVIQ